MSSYPQLGELLARSEQVERKEGFDPETIKALAEMESSKAANRIAQAKADTANKLAKHLTWGLLVSLIPMTVLAFIPKSCGLLTSFEFGELILKIYIPILTLALGFYFGSKVE